MTQITILHQTPTSQLLADRLAELHFPPEFFPPADLKQLEALVEKDRAKLDAEYQEKLRERVAKLISRKSIASVIRDTPETPAATSASSNGGAL